MWIVVDANKSRNGLAKLLAATWDFVNVRRLTAGDIAIGPRVLVERKTTQDFVASLHDGRLFRQAQRLAELAPRPILIQEGDPATIESQLDEGQYRGALLSLTVGFRIPIVYTRNLEHTATVLRHMAAQESKRQTRRRKNDEPKPALTSDALNVIRAIPGVGQAKANHLATHVQSPHDLTQLTIRDLINIPGIGPNTAAQIIDTLRPPK